jgi:heat shock protein HslJ
MRAGRLAVAVALVALLAGAVAACGDSGTGGATTAADRGGPLEGRWSLSGVADAGTTTAPPAGVTATAVFEGGRLSGRAPVNTFTGSYTATAEGALELGPVARTQMAGTPEANAAEEVFFRLLESARAYRSAGGVLTLLDAGGSTVLTFDAAPVTLVGDWEVTGYNNGRQAVVGTVDGSAITADFAEGGALTGDAGVNRYTTEYTATAAGAATLEVRIAPPATTRRAGPPELMAQEARYLAALESARTAVLDGDTATLRDGSDAIAVTMRRR